MLVRLVIRLLKSKKITVGERAEIASALLEKLNAFPAKDIIRNGSDGRIYVNDRPLDVEGARVLRESAIAALQNQARKFVKEQVSFKAVNIGIHQGNSTEQIIFSKAALWWGQEEDALLEILAQNGDKETP